MAARGRLAAFLGLMALPVVAQAAGWVDMANISPTLGNQAGRLCIGAGRADIGCPVTAPALDLASGALTMGGLLSVPLISATTGIFSGDLTVRGNLFVSGSQTIEGVTFANGGVSATGTVTATSFAGDGSGLTGVVASSADRLVSGTQSAVLNAGTGTISLTTGGTTWGYFGSGLSYLPQLAAAGVSVTGTVYATGVQTEAVTISSTGNAIATYQAGAGQAYSGVNGSNGTFYMGTTTPNDAVWITNNAERVRINPAGNVGIGTADPSATFHVSGTGILTSWTTIASNSVPRYPLDIAYGVSGWGARVGSPANNLLLSFNQLASFGGALLLNAAYGRNVLIAGGGGRVGIGAGFTLSSVEPSTTLHVAGSLRLAAETSATLNTCDANRTGAIKYESGDFSVCRNGANWETLTAIAQAAASVADRISSGTTTVQVVSATGFVSLTQAGTNTGWFDPQRGLVTLGVSSTGPISGTQGYFGNGPSGVSLNNALGSPNQTGGGRFLYSGQGAVTLYHAGLTSYFMADSGVKLALGATGTGGTPAIMISGTNVGLGTANPAVTLDVSGSSLFNAPVLISTTANSGMVRFYNGTATGYVGQLSSGNNMFLTNQYAGNLYLATSDTTRVTIRPNGDVGIGTFAPSATLHVSGTGLFDTGTITATTVYALQVSGTSYAGSGILFSRSGMVPWALSTGAGGFITFANPSSGAQYLKYNLANNRLGIAFNDNNNLMPSQTLHVSGTALITSWAGINFDSANVTPTAPLEVSGTVSATRFVGDGSGLSGITAAATDRIVSGSTSMLAVSATGFVSLTQVGTDTGWFDPTRGLVTLGVSATGTVSATAGYFTSRLGIGTMPVTSLLAVSGSVASMAIVPTGDTLVSSRNLYLMSSNGWIYLQPNGSSNTVLTASSNAVAINLGTSIPSATFHVSGSILGTSWTYLNANPAVRTAAAAPLEVSGTVSATRFVGDGSGLTNISASAISGISADRLTSGSSIAVLNSTTGTVSLTQAGTTWGYVAPSGWSYLPQLKTGWLATTGTVSTNLELNSTGGNQNTISFQRNSSQKWQLGLGTSPTNDFFLWDQTATRTVVQALPSGSLSLMPGGGNVGIGTSSPNAALEVSGVIKASGNIYAAASIYASNSGVLIGYGGTAILANSPGNWGNSLRVGPNSLSGYVDNMIAIYASATGLSTSASFVGINNTSPRTSLDVSGSLRLKAETAGSGYDACDANRTGAIRYTAGDFSVCRNGASWETLTAIAQGAAAVADRISSGTTTVQVVSSSGFVSITQAGTNTGWFDPTRGLVTLGVSTTGPISATDGYFGTGIVNIASATGNAVTLFKSGALQGYIGINAGAGTFYTGTTTNSPMALLTNNLARLTVTGAGLVGIGTSAPFYPLDVSGAIMARGDNNALFLADRTNGVSTSAIYRQANVTRFWDSLGGDRMVIDNTTGNVGIGTTNPAAAGLVVSNTIAVGDFSGGTSYPAGRFMVYKSGNYGLPATSGGSDTAVITRFWGGSVVLDYGLASNGNGWFQQRRVDDFSIKLPLLLNPNGGGVGIGLVTPSGLVSLEVSGTVSATRFVGDGSGLTNISASAISGISADRLTSGSSVVTLNSATGIVSLTRAGTTWGYLDPSSYSYLPSLATEAISSSIVNVYNGDATPSTLLDIRSTSTDPSSTAMMSVAASSGGAVGLVAYGSSRSISVNSYSTGRPGGVGLYTAGASTGGLTFAARSASGSMYFYTGGNNERMRVTEAGNVGIGTTAPTVALEVSGTVSATRFVGDGSGLTNVAGDRIVSGSGAAIINPTGDLTVRGRLDIVSGNSVVAIGQGAAQSSTALLGTTAVGYQAAQNVTTGNGLAAFGYQAGQNNAGNLVSVFGTWAAQNNTGTNVNAFGFSAARNNTSGGVVAIGNNTASNNAGSNLVAIGDSAANNNSGAFVTAIGPGSGAANTFNNVTLLGYNVAAADKDNQVVLGNGSVVEVSTSGIYVGKGVSVSGAVTATRFVGDGSGLTNLPGSSADRLTSGSSLVTLNSATGIVSLTQAGSTWSYLHPTLGLVAPGVSTTGPISGTGGYFAGPVGIGTNAPFYPLDVSGGIMARGANNALYLADRINGVSASAIYRQANVTRFWDTLGGDRMVIDNTSGNVGIGLSNPSYPLHVSGTVVFYPGNTQFPTNLYLLPSGHATSRRVLLSMDRWNLLQDSSGSGNKDFTIYDSVSNTTRLGFTAEGRTYLPSTTQLIVGPWQNTGSSLTVVNGEIQPGSSGAGCASGNAGAIRYASGALTYCTGSVWAALASSGTANVMALSDLSDVSKTVNNLFLGWITGANANVTNTTAVGPQVFGAGTNSGFANVAVGNAVLYYNTTGRWNSVVGNSALGNNTTGDYNSMMGFQAGLYNSTGNENTAFGAAAAYWNDTGSQNTSIGRGANRYNVGGSYNTLLGSTAGQGISSSTAYSNVTAAGYRSLFRITAGNDNTAIGAYAGQNVSSGSSNTILGYNAGLTLTTGSDNILIGNGANVPANGTSNFLNIGNTLYGNLSSGYIGIGNPGPIYPLVVSGNAAFGGPSSGLGFSMALQGTSGATGYTGYYLPNGIRVGYVGFGQFGTQMNIATDGATPLRFITSGTDAMWIGADGNVGIGVAGPSNPLEVRRDQNASTDVTIRNSSNLTSAAARMLLTGDVGSAVFTYNGSGSSVSAYAGGPSGLGIWTTGSGGIAVSSKSASGTIRFYSGVTPTERARIDASGNVGIGTGAVSLTEKLVVNGNIKADQFCNSAGVCVDPASLVANPSGQISAFDLATCPAGWSEYTPARGRFLRGIDNGAGNDPSGTRVAGNIQDDALQNISGTLNTGHSFKPYGPPAVGTGALRPGPGDSGQTYGGSLASGYTGTFNFDASRAARTADETRPKNVAVLFCRKN